MSMFDKFKILHGLPKVGQKITFVKPTHSWFINVREDSKKLVGGTQYTVRKTELNSSSTYVWLEEFPNIFDPNDGRDQPFFNMASFDWEPPKINLEDLIGMSPMDLCRLTNPPYNYGIEFDGKLQYKGSPIIVVEYKKLDNRWNSDEVTNAYFKKDDN